MASEDLRAQLKLPGDVLEKTQGQFAEAIEAAYRDGAIDGCFYGGGQATNEHIDALWSASDTKETIDNSSKS
jgi:hypothetical protein